MRHSLALAALLLPLAASAARYSEDYEARSSLEGLYVAVAGGGQLMIFGGNNAFGYAVEGRAGYSFNPGLQLYLSGALDGSSFSGRTVRMYQVAAYLQYHFLVKPAVMVYGRGGIGVGVSSNAFLSSTGTAAGFAEGGGIGVEIRVGPDLFLAPELFYRGATLSAQGYSDSYQVVGLQLALVYY